MPKIHTYFASARTVYHLSPFPKKPSAHLTLPTTISCVSTHVIITRCHWLTQLYSDSSFSTAPSPIASVFTVLQIEFLNSYNYASSQLLWVDGWNEVGVIIHLLYDL